MKKLILILALLPTLAFAQRDPCQDMYAVAETVMQARQAGITKTDYKAFASRELPPLWASLARQMADAAYRQPIYKSSKVKDAKASDFAAKYYVQCVEVRDGN